ncbi:MAG TPA: PilZ domain-containing protein [Thermodesulfobacteriota bacterium]|nr:PilZ domain-containing protein [Thermodesulfobacteriota bacterium]
MEDRRRSERRQLLGEIRIRPDGSEWTQAVLTNINRGGVGLYVFGPMNKKESVSMRITYLKEGELNETEEVRGTVRWVKEIGGYNAAGIMFAEEINSRKYPNLLRCLEYVEGK